MALRRLSMIGIVLVFVAGCGARAKPAAAPTEPDYDWSSFTGGVAPPPAKSAATNDASDAKDAKDKADAVDAKKVSTKKIAGQSLSEVGADAVATATERAMRLSVVSTNVIVGPEYEQLNVLFKGVSVQIVRPAATPDKAGPKVRSPKARSEDIAKTDSALYDAAADVLVLVQAQKKATSKRTLAALLAGSASPAKKKPRAAKPKRAS